MGNGEVSFRSIIEDKGDIIRFGKNMNIDNGRQERIDAKAEALNWLTSFFNDTVFENRTANEIKKLKSEIDSKLLPKGGVLIVVIYTQNIDFGYKNFENVHIGGWGMDCRTVISEYKKLGKMVMLPNSSFTVKESYIWVTET